MFAGKDTWSQAGEAEREVERREFAKFLDLNRSKRSVVRGQRGECRQPIWLRARAGSPAWGAGAGKSKS